MPKAEVEIEELGTLYKLETVSTDTISLTSDGWQEEDKIYTTTVLHPILNSHY